MIAYGDNGRYIRIAIEKLVTETLTAINIVAAKPTNAPPKRALKGVNSVMT